MGRHRRLPAVLVPETIENIQIARRLGASGIILFSYDSLVSLPRGLDYLSQIARAAFFTE